MKIIVIVIYIFIILLSVITIVNVFGYQEINPPNIILEYQEAEVIMFSSTTITTSSQTDIFYNVWNTCSTYLELHK